MTKQKMDKVREALKTLILLSKEDWVAIKADQRMKSQLAVVQNLIQDIDYEKETYQVLKEIGVQEDMVGFKYLKKAIMLCIENPSIIDRADTGLYTGVAIPYGTTKEIVVKEIQNVLGKLCEEGRVSPKMVEIFASRTTFTIEQFIIGVANYVDRLII